MQKELTKSCRMGLLGISLIVIVLDQISKYIVRGHLELYQLKPVMPFWNWTLAYNEGAAFSFLASQNGWQKIFFAGIAIAVSIGLIYYIMTKPFNLLAGLAFSFILGGALGNLIDRIVAGKVTDFIDWYVGTHHWPAFNVADSFITVGVTLLIIDSLFVSKK
ncbi:signal peptidase II [Aquella oligotrophica]|nr:signal peptidase II [Aquella oligotrophica]